MKKKISALLVAMAILASPAFINQAKAVDVGIGVTTMYQFWEPSWSDVYDKVEVESFPVYGITGTISFYDNWSFSLTGIYGKSEGKIIEEGQGISGYYRYEINQDIERFDVDAVLSYWLSSRFSIFTGLKFISLDFGAKEVSLSYSGPYNIDGFDDHAAMSGAGIGFGLGYNQPLIQQILYLSFNISAVYLNTYYALFWVNPDQEISYENDQNYHTYGINTTLSLSYYIEAMSTAIVFGSRYQHLKYKAVGEERYNMGDDILYGITLSAMYYF